jgi:hypothetical protein
LLLAHIITTIVWLHFVTLKKNSSIFGKVNDFNFIIEFQNRGSEHDHGLLCTKDGPICGVDSNETIEQFVDKYVTSNISLLHICKIHKCINVGVVGRKIRLLVNFIIHCHRCFTQKILEPLKEVI